MKTLFLVLDRKTNFLVGAYPSVEITDFEVAAAVCANKYDARNIYIKKEENVEDEVFDRLVEQYRRKDIWN